MLNKNKIYLQTGSILKSIAFVRSLKHFLLFEGLVFVGGNTVETNSVIGTNPYPIYDGLERALSLIDQPHGSNTTLITENTPHALKTRSRTRLAIMTDRKFRLSHFLPASSDCHPLNELIRF